MSTRIRGDRGVNWGITTGQAATVWEEQMSAKPRHFSPIVKETGNNEEANFSNI